MADRKKPKSSSLVPRAVLLEGLREVGRHLGRTPTYKDWDRLHAQFGLPCTGTYAKRFGAYSTAVKAAGLPAVIKQDFTREELIVQLRNLARHLGGPITRDDVRDARLRHTCANLETFIREFGSVALALKVAGVNRKHAVTEAALVKDLKDLARKLGRPPSSDDLRRAAKRRECRWPDVYARMFGSHHASLKAAGLVSATEPYTRKELLDHLREFHRELGRIPTNLDMRERSAAGLMPGLSTYSRFFGGMHNALREAKLAETPVQIRKRFILALRQVTDEIGYAPTFDEWIRLAQAGKLPDPGSYRVQFGSIDEARREAGVIDRLPPGHPYHHGQITAGDVLEHLRGLAGKLGAAPTRNDINQATKDGALIGMNAIQRLFGTLTAAKTAAGMPLGISRRNKPLAGRAALLVLNAYSDDELLHDLRQFAKTLGRVPTEDEMRTAAGQGRMAAKNTYRYHFGTWEQALLAAGLTPVPRSERHRRYRREDLIRSLRQLAKKLKRTPTHHDIRESSKRGEGPTEMTYYRMFGGLPQAREAAGLPAVRTRVRTPGAETRTK
jgi:hypothetical protein